MEFLELFQVFSMWVGFLVLLLLLKLSLSCWLLPVRALKKLRNNGFDGPAPSFPLGNYVEMKKLKKTAVMGNAMSSSGNTTIVNHDIHSIALPYFAQWQKQYGKVFVYWLGTESFLYIADPEFLQIMSKGVLGKTWGKPNVFKKDRKAMFGKGLVMVEGDDWTRHRHIITPAFSPLNLKGMTSLMVESATGMLDRWAVKINSGNPEIDVEREIIATAGEIISKTSFGVTGENGRRVLENLRAVQYVLFKSNRYVGTPFNDILSLKNTMKSRKLGKEIDGQLLSIINERRRLIRQGEKDENHRDLLGLLLKAEDKKDGRKLTARELVDECKTFFFAGHETTALALTWTMMLLAIYPEWQTKLRVEIGEVIGDSKIDYTKLAGLKKMTWVMNEVLRLYPPAPNTQRQVRQDIEVGAGRVVPAGTNIWIDSVAMHHDEELWGKDVNEFRPERFADDLHGGCKNKMGFLPFGFGGRMCIGRNLTVMEYKVVLTLVLSRFEVSVSSDYRHCPSYMLSLRPAHGLPLIVRPLI